MNDAISRKWLMSYLNNVSGWSPLHMAAYNRFEDTVSALSQAGADINAQATDVMTLLGVIIRTNFGSGDSMDYIDMADLLIKAGANVNAKAKNDRRPLDYAMLTGWKDMVQLMVNAGAQQNLHSAAMLGEVKSLNALLATNVKVNMTLESGYTALHFAVEGGHEDIVHAMVEHGANVKIPTKGGVTPLRFAGFVPRKWVYELLLAGGVDVNAQESRGWTPLDYLRRFVRKDIKECEQVLRAAGAKTKDELKNSARKEGGL